MLSSHLCLHSACQRACVTMQCCAVHKLHDWPGKKQGLKAVAAYTLETPCMCRFLSMHAMPGTGMPFHNMVFNIMRVWLRPGQACFAGRGAGSSQLSESQHRAVCMKRPCLHQTHRLTGCVCTSYVHDRYNKATCNMKVKSENVVLLMAGELPEACPAKKSGYLAESPCTACTRRWHRHAKHRHLPSLQRRVGTALTALHLCLSLLHQ